MKNAARIGLRAGIRTTAQAMAGLLSAVSIVSIARPDLIAVGSAIAVATLASLLAGVIAFFQNFAEQLPEE